MQLRYNIDRSDLSAAQSAANVLCQSLRRGALAPFLLNVAIWACIGFAVMSLFQADVRQTANWYYSSSFILLLLVVAGVLAALCNTLVARRIRIVQLAAFEPFPVEQTLTVVEDGLSFESRWGTALYRWSALQGLRELPQHVALIVRPYMVIVVPHRAFPSVEDRVTFAGLIRAKTGL